jgi:hypothetical protein
MHDKSLPYCTTGELDCTVGPSQGCAKVGEQQPSPNLVILNAVKNLVLYRDVAFFLWDSVAERKVVFGCLGARFFAALRMTKGSRVLYSGATILAHPSVVIER